MSTEDATGTAVAQDGSAGEVGPQQPSWAGKMCPLLSVATMRPEPESKVLIPGRQQTSNRPMSGCPCQGPGCALFVPILDDAGRYSDGACALALFPTAVNMLGIQLAKGLSQYQLRKK